MYVRLLTNNFLSEKAVGKSESKDVHLAVLRVLPEVIRESVDADASSKSVIIYDPATGEKKMVSPTAVDGIESLGEVKTAEQREAEINAQMQDAIQRSKDWLEGNVANPVGMQIQLGDGRIATIGAMHEDGSSAIATLPDGTQFLVSKDVLQRIVNNGHYADYKARRDAEASKREAEQSTESAPETATEGGQPLPEEVAPKEEERREYAQGDEFEVIVDGQKMHAEIVSPKDADGRFVVNVDDGESMRTLYVTPEELAAMEYREEPSPKVEDTRLTTEDSSEKALERGEQPTEEHAPTALERIPRDEKGNAQFHDVDTETAWDGLVEMSGNEETAHKVAEASLANAEKKLKAAKALKEKGETPEELLQSIKENEKAVAEAEREVDAWKAIAGEKTRREEAAKAEAERIAAEKAEEARVEAERKAEEERKTKEEERKERDENGQPFVVSSDGTTTFGEITEDTGLTAAPIKLSEGVADEKGNGYGLRHIEARHGDQIRKAGFSSVEEFIEQVAKNYDVIKEGSDRNGNKTYRLLLTDKHNNTLMIELSKDGSYWNVNTAGVFKKSYGKDKKEVYNRHTTVKQSAETAETSQADEHSGTQSTSRMNVPTTSADKGTTLPADQQTSDKENTKKVADSEGENTLKAKIEAASADVNTEPTEAQKKAGNYKKGHVQVGTFDITIEQPEGSIRRGTDADGKKWEIKMHNTYGYFRGTEGVDGDHIDVFLSNDIDGWNGRKVFVVDQYNPDGTFDEHKVMLGFNDMDEAKSDYLANYEKGWENGRRITVSTTNLEDFEKWIDSSHRKTKPFSEYSSVNKETVATDKGGEKAEKKQEKQSVFDKAKEIADKEEKKRKAEAEDDSVLGQATRAVGKKKKVNRFKYTASEKNSNLTLRGVHYANGYAYASDGYILFKEKADYPKEWEGTTRDKDGNLIDGKYPDTEKAIHRLVHIPDKEVESLPSKEVLDFAIAASKKLKGEAIPVAIDGIFFNAVNLKKFLEAVASKGMDKVVYRHPMLYATNGKDEIVMMPTVNTLEGALDIADKMESAGLPKEQIDAWKAHIEAADKKKSFDDFKKAVENAKKEGVRPTEADKQESKAEADKTKQKPLTEAERKDAEEVAGALGYRVEWVDTMEENGTIDADKKVIRIAKDAENPLVQVLGHEVTHGVKRMDGGKFKALQKAAMEVAGEKEWNERIEKKRKLNAYAEGKLAEEVTCDIVGEALNDKDALKRLAESLRGEKGILARLRDAVARMVEYFKNRGDKEGVRRMKAADRLLAEFESALKKDVASGQANPEGVDRSVREGKKDDRKSGKERQFDIITKTNPMLDDYHTGIREVDDIKTFGEAIDEARKEAEKYGDETWSAYPDITNDLLNEAERSGEITIYSSKPIKNGVFVTPSLMQATDYAGGEVLKVHSKTVPLDKVAWINLDEGQYADTSIDRSVREKGELTDAEVAEKERDIDHSVRSSKEMAEERLEIERKAKSDGTWLKAPNGKRTNLNERQWVDVRTKNFKEWFGDWENDPENASKIVDENGEPLMVFHYTPEDFTVFGEGKEIGASTFYNASDANYAATAAAGDWFTSKSDLPDYMGKPMRVFLNIKEPSDGRSLEVLADEVGYEISSKDYEAFDEDRDNTAPIIEAGKNYQEKLRDRGYDGIFIADEEFGGTSYITFAPNQIKSAVENDGSYSPKENDIRRSVREKKEDEKTELTAEERELRDNLVERMRKGGLDVVTDSEEMQRVIDTENERTRNKRSKKSEAARKRDEALYAVDWSTAFVSGKSREEATEIRRERGRKFKEETKELYGRVLSGNFDDVTLRLIDEFIDKSTPNNPYERPISKRLPTRALQKMRGGERTGSIDALFSRISESAVGKDGKALPRAERERAIEEKKKELLKKWAIATGNWHTDVSDFSDGKEPIGSGTDSDVYLSKDGKSVIKVSKGKPYGKRFRPDVDNVALFNTVFPGSRYTIEGYGEIDGKFVRFLEQPIVDFTNSTPLTEGERVAYMEKLGFKPINKENTAFSNGEIIASDLQKSNIVKDEQGNIRVIDADMKLHTKDFGGKFSYPDAETDTRTDGMQRFLRTADGEVYGLVKDGRIYLDPKVATSETAVHKYTHLWGDMLRRKDSEQWSHTVKGLKNSVLWEEVKESYPELKTDDEIADEVLSTFSGRRGAERLREEARRVADGEGGVFTKAKAIETLERVKEAIARFWEGVAKMFGINRYRSAEELADMAMKDLLDSKNPMKDESGMRKRGEVGDEGVKSLKGDEALTALDSIFGENEGSAIPPKISSFAKFKNLFKKPVRTFLGELVQVKDEVWNKILRNNRQDITGTVLPTIENADFAIRDTDGSTLYVKRFKGDGQERMYNVVVVNKHGEVEDYISSVHIKRDNNLRNKIKKGAELFLPNARTTDGTMSRNNSTPDAKVANYSETAKPRFSRKPGESIFDYASRVSDSVDRSVREIVSARDEYEKKVKSKGFQTKEALQNSMLGLQEFMYAIDRASGNKRYIEDIPDFENPILGENRLSSVNKEEMHQVAKTQFKPLMSAVAKLSDNGKESGELYDYMFAKHGLERDAVMRQREAQKEFDKYQKAHPKGTKTIGDFVASLEGKDYAGLTALTAEDGRVKSIQSQIDAIDEQMKATDDQLLLRYLGGQKKRLKVDLLNAARDAADDIRKAFESNPSHDRSDINELWKRVNEVNGNTLRKLYESGLLTKEAYDDISSMYTNYIPMRGFDQTTSADAYAYLTHGDSAFNAPIKTAKGRSSKADNPIAYMQAMAESAIMQGNRNVLVKQKMLNFVRNHPSDLASVSDVWLQYDSVADEWKPFYAFGRESKG